MVSSQADGLFSATEHDGSYEQIRDALAGGREILPRRSKAPSPPTPLRRNAIAATCLGQQALSLQALEADVEERCRWVSRDGALKGVRGRFEVQHLDHYSNREGADGRGIDEKIGLSSEQIYRKVSGGPDDRVGDTAGEGGSDDGDRHKHPEDKNVRHRGWTLQDEACVHLCKADKKGYAEDAIGEWCGHAMAKAS